MDSETSRAYYESHDPTVVVRRNTNAKIQFTTTCNALNISTRVSNSSRSRSSRSIISISIIPLLRHLLLLEEKQFTFGSQFTIHWWEISLDNIRLLGYSGLFLSNSSLSLSFSSFSQPTKGREDRTTEEGKRHTHTPFFQLSSQVSQEVKSTMAAGERISCHQAKVRLSTTNCIEEVVLQTSPAFLEEFPRGGRNCPFNILHPAIPFLTTTLSRRTPQTS